MRRQPRSELRPRQRRVVCAIGGAQWSRHLRTLVDSARRTRWANLVVANLRILIGFAFLPAGLRKVLYQRFTDVDNVGAFHEFLHAFYDTGVFYQFVGVVQLVIAALLMSQMMSALAALLALPVIGAITVFCWSTLVIPTAIVATLMLLGTAALAMWDIDRWRSILFRPSEEGRSEQLTPADSAADRVRAIHSEPPIDISLWRRCGVAILLLYLAICAISGEIYRPRGVEWDNPAFYMLPLIAVFPVATLAYEQLRRRSWSAATDA